MRLAGVALMLIGCGRIGFDPAARGGDDGPTPDAAVNGFSKLIAYADQTCAVYEGAAYCWGRNDDSQIGDGTQQNAAVPTRVQLPAGTVHSFAQGEHHGCAVVAGALYCWGNGFNTTPTMISLPAAAIAVDAGRDFTCVIADQLYCFGNNDAGQLGDTTQQAKPNPTPVSIPGTITGIDVGDDHACAIASTGTASCWGHNDNGTMGNGSFNPPNQLTPDGVIGGITSLPQIAGWHACNLQSGEVRCWGRNTEGELGNGDPTDSPQPIQLALAGITVLATGGGPTDFDATCAGSGTTIDCWGGGLFGRLGNGLTTDQGSPVGVAGLPGSAVRELALGYDHSCAAFADGDIWCWGRGDAGQLGNGGFSDSLIPVRVTPPP